MTYDFPEDETDEREMGRAGAWITPSYTWNGRAGDVSILGIGRYIRDERGDSESDLYDVGARLIWQMKTIPIALSIEHLQRSADGDAEDSDRTVGVIEYELAEDIHLIASYGKTFDDEFEGDGDLVAIAGLNFGWGKGPTINQ